MATYLITGGTGMVGTELTEILISSGHEVIVLTRRKKESKVANLSYAVWDIDRVAIEEGVISNVDYIIHLAGENVAAERWSAKRKQAILDSRVKSGECMVKALKNNPHKVKAIVAASAIGWYGPDTKDSLINGFKEDADCYTDFLGTTCLAWEQSMKGINNLGIRLVTLRIGIVLSNKGGALKEFMKPLRFGLAVSMGSGKQMISWIALTDLCRLILFSLDNESMMGAYNAVSPKPVSNKTLVDTLRKTMGNKLTIPISAPSFLLKLMLGEMSIEILKSVTVSAKKVEKTGFRFIYPDIKEAIKAIVEKKNTPLTQ